MRKITDLHRLYWTDRTENYMFDGCLRSVLAALGEPQYNFDFFAALTGDFFTQMFDPARAVDSLTHDCFQPQMAEHAFSACGYGCTVLQGDAIATKSDQALARVRESVERGVPAIVRGLAGHDAFCLIGGYGDGETLFVNFWDDQTSADGYTPIETGLAGTTELILAGDKVGEPALGEVFHTILESIPKHLTRAPQGSCVFGRQAVMRWAEALLDEQNFTGSDEEIEARRAILHDAPLAGSSPASTGSTRSSGRCACSRRSTRTSSPRRRPCFARRTAFLPSRKSCAAACFAKTSPRICRASRRFWTRSMRFFVNEAASALRSADMLRGKEVRQ